MFRRKLLKNHYQNINAVLFDTCKLSPTTHIPHNITYINSKTLVAVVYNITNDGDVFN